MKREARPRYVAQGPSPERGRRQRPLPTAARSQFRRYLEENRVYLITTNTEERQPIFVNPRLCAVVIENLAFYRDRGDFSLHAYVVMPDHIHLAVWSENAADVQLFIRQFLRMTSAEIVSLASSAAEVILRN